MCVYWFLVEFCFCFEITISTIHVTGVTNCGQFSFARQSEAKEKINVFRSAGDMCVTTTNKLFVIKIPLGSSESLSVARLPLFFFLVCARCNLKYSFYVSGEFNWFLLWTLRKVYRFPFFTARILRIFRCSLALCFLWDTIIVISSKGARTFIIASCFQPTIRKTKLNNKKMPSKSFTFF